MNGDLYPRVAFKVLRRGNNLLAEATQSYPGVPLRIHLSETKEPGKGSIKSHKLARSLIPHRP